MIGFVVPFKAKKNSNNWELDCVNLNKTLKSICNQSDSNFKVFVIFTDLPINVFKHQNIDFVFFNLTFISTYRLYELEKIENPSFQAVLDERSYDQGRRILFGCLSAKQSGCKFVMNVDADDYIRNDISSFVNNNPDERYGWFVNKGYLLNDNSRILIKVKKNMNFINGSTHILNINIIPQIDLVNALPTDCCFFSAHGYLRERIKVTYGGLLKPIPFYALIYYIHETNWSGLKKIMKKQPFKTFIKYLVNGHWLSSNIKKKFGIP